MNLGKNVYNLLKRQPEVYVEGLGSFKRNHTPATYDEKRNVYLPPITYIDFDRTSTKGYDFIQYVQQLQLIDRSEARELVAAQVEDLLRRVQEDAQAKLDSLGYLVSYGESYVFKALDLSGFNYEVVEGIAGQPLPVPVEVEKDSVVEKEPEPTVTDVVEDAPVEDVEAKTEIDQPVAAEIIDTAAPEEEVPASRSNMIWYVIAVLVAIGIMIALYWTNQNQATTAQKQATASAVDTNVRTQDTASSSFGIDTAQAGSVTGAEDGVVDSARVVSAQKALIPADHTWQIVIGSHKTLAQAYEQAESYNKAGFPKVRVIPSNLAKNRKKVIWDSYRTKQEADSALKYVQRHHIRDAWPDKINE